MPVTRGRRSGGGGEAVGGGGVGAVRSGHGRSKSRSKRTASAEEIVVDGPVPDDLPAAQQGEGQLLPSALVPYRRVPADRSEAQGNGNRNNRRAPMLVHGATFLLWLLMAMAFVFVTKQLWLNVWGATSMATAFLNNWYHDLKTGGRKVECSVGGSIIGMLECEVFLGFNRILLSLIQQLFEYSNAVLNSKNIFQLGLFVWSSLTLIRGLFSRLIPLFSELSRLTLSASIQFYWTLHDHLLESNLLAQ